MAPSSVRSGTDGPAHAVQLMTAAAALRFEQAAAIGQLRHAGDLAFFVAPPAGSADVFLGQQRLLPERHLSVRVLLVGGQPLPAVADRAAEPRGDVRRQVGVKREGLRRILHGRVFHAQVAGGAAVHALQSGQQVLPDDQRPRSPRRSLPRRWVPRPLPAGGTPAGKFSMRACRLARRPPASEPARSGSARRRTAVVSVPFTRPPQCGPTVAPAPSQGRGRMSRRRSAPR